MLEIGCGTGAICRLLAGRPEVSEVLGADPSPILLAKGRELARGIANLSLRKADGRDLLSPDASFDVAVLHRVLSPTTC